jgi:hypothetical protein
MLYFLVIYSLIKRIKPPALLGVILKGFFIRQFFREIIPENYFGRGK